MNRPVRTIRNSLLIGLPLAISPMFVHAQTENTSGQSGAVLEEIVVTATKRPQSVRDIPTSINAFSGDDLTSIGATTLGDIVKLSPGVTLEPGFTPNSSTVQIRGITNETRGVGPRTVGRFFDGVPLINPSIIGAQPDLDTVDMQTVEVLKGPQGTLFGGSALAGAVRYVPNSPDFEGFSGLASVGYGQTADSDGHNSEYALMLNVPLSDNFALRFAGAVRDFPGYIYDQAGDIDDINSYKSEHARVAALWQVTDNLSVRANYLTQSGDVDAYSFVEGTEASLVRQFKYTPEFEDSELDIYGVRFDWSNDAFTVVFDNNWLEKERSSQADLTYVVGLHGTGITVNQNFMPTTDQYSNELRIVSNQPTGGNGLFSDWQYTVGLYHMKADQTRPSVVAIDFGAMVNRSIGGEFADATEKALYFDLTRMLSDSWELNLGGRYFDQVTDGGNFLTGGDDLGIPDASATAKLDESGFNPKAALLFHANDDLTFYGSIAEGFRFGGINGQAAADINAGVPTTYKSDSLTNYEVGVRSSWLEQRLTADLSLFLIDWSDVQVQQRAGVVAYVDNIGKAKSKGLEFSLHALLSGGFSAHVVGSYTDAYTDADFDSATDGFIAAGTTLAQAPKWNTAIDLSYDGSWSNWDVNSSLTYSYRDSSKNNLQNTIPLDSLSMLDFSIGLKRASGEIRPKISLIAKNLSNEQVATYGFTLGAANLVSMNMPRQVMLRLDLEF